MLGVLARSPGPLPAPTLESVWDYLAAANARFRGCRAILDRDQENTAFIEGRLSASAMSAETARDVVAALAQSGRLMAAACRVLYEVPAIGEAYVRCLMAGESVQA